jgi:hypothetical protein
MSAPARRLLPDAHDTIVGIGVLLLTAGVAKLSVAWAMIIAGALLVGIGLVGVMRKAR